MLKFFCLLILLVHWNVAEWEKKVSAGLFAYQDKAILNIEVNGYTFRKNNSAIFIFASLLNGVPTLKRLNLPHTKILSFKKQSFMSILLPLK